MMVRLPGHCCLTKVYSFTHSIREMMKVMCIDMCNDCEFADILCNGQQLNFHINPIHHVMSSGRMALKADCLMHGRRGIHFNGQPQCIPSGQQL